MKRIFTIAAIAAASILAASCAKEMEEDIQKEGIIAHASLQPVEATKAIGEYSYNIVWEENDKIAVLDNANSKASFKLKDGAGSTTGTFQQEGTDALTAPLTAYYPASVVAEDKSLVWPVTQADVKNITNVPMRAESSTATGDVNFAFKHLGSVLQLVLTAKNGTIAVKQIDITADQGLSGAFTVKDGAAVISSTGTTITTGDISDKNIKLSAAASYLNFAVPSGSFTNFKITITDVNDKEFSLSAANLTLNRAMVNKVTFAMDAKSDALYELNVNGHLVKIVYSSDDGIKDDVWIKKAEVVDNSVVVTARSNSAEHLKCTMSDSGDFCTSQSKKYGPVLYNEYGRAIGYQYLLYSFTISNITNNTTATIGYANPVSIALSPADAGCKVTVKGGVLYEGELVRLVPDTSSDASYSYGISSWKDQNGKILSDGYDYTVRLSQEVQITACFEENLALGGVFTVANDGKGNVKKVRFTRGNLYYDGSSKVEQHQYDFNSGTWTGRGHISHFMWCNNISDAAKQQYNTSWNGQAPFFANDSTFTVNGFDAGKCYALSDWKYLLNEREASTVNGTSNARYFKGCINKEDGKSINGLFIFPDEFTWPSSVKTLPDEINEASSGYDNTYTYNDFKRLQDAGMVFLPAAGYRDSNRGDTDVNLAGSSGYYWSASQYDVLSAHDLLFSGGNVYPNRHDSRIWAYAVRLVTESK